MPSQAANGSGLTMEVTGPYFGQTPPGNTPELFAHDILLKILNELKFEMPKINRIRGLLFV